LSGRLSLGWDVEECSPVSRLYRRGSDGDWYRVRVPGIPEPRRVWWCRECAGTGPPGGGDHGSYGSTSAL